MKKYPVLVLSAGIAVFLAACGSSGGSGGTSGGTSSSTKLDHVSIVMSWTAQPEAGGFYEAQQDGIYKKYGLDVKVIQGGPQVNRYAIVASGQAQFGQGASYEILAARKGGLQAVALMATLQQDPIGLMYHTSDPLKSFADLKGRTVYVSPGQAYWAYISKKYNLGNSVRQLTYTSLTPFFADPHAVNQDIIDAEPYYAKQAGVNVGTILVGASGFASYVNTVFATQSYIASHHSIVQRFIKASILGWKDYLKNPTPINKYITTISKQETLAGETWAMSVVTPLFSSADTRAHGFGYMSPAVWQAAGKQMKDLGLIPEGMNVSDAYNLSFFNAASAH